MKRIVIFLGIIVSAALFVFIAGCGKNGNDITGDNSIPAPKIVNVFPADGSTDVPIGTDIGIKFDMPMDTLSVMQNFYFSGGDNMHLWMDSLNQYQNMGGMGNMMDMDHMMNWIDSIHISGEFHWNESGDSCLYIPGTMVPDTDYMIYINGDIMSHDGNMMDMHHLDYEGHMYHFTTVQ